jgi:hypothetical protein
MTGELQVTKNVSISVEIGYELRSVTLTQSEWSAVQAGKPLSKEVQEPYEEKLFVYKFSFNGGEQLNVNLCVTYREEGEDWAGGEGFMGMIEDALVNETS